ncbi:hypothetical protein BGZ99_001641 [Dissophora globulifera]|uniref:Glutathione S-transferase n=1 Tax=Dissophora globulifera TaxID=979702 RepID=A0A9P6UJV9_9FUNG|nr:hypothetical protein BGZ99_001641 [Dissophora globulifera]
MSEQTSAFHTYPQDEYTITDDALKKSRFEIEYFPVRARAETVRYLLEYVGANYTSVTPVNWPATKKDTPFGMLTVLTHHKPDGSVFEVGEGVAYMRYLASLFGLKGSNIEEDAVLDSCFSCVNESLFNAIVLGIWRSSDPKSKENIDKAFEKMTSYFDGMERYLVKNGSNGYLLGEKTTYPEFAWYDWMGYLYDTHPEQMNAIASETTRPALYKMYKRLSANPRLRAYIAGGRWQFRPTPAAHAAT